jgi:Domain of unknown function (DUF4331)
MSHHFDSPTAIQDGRLNLCDVFAFPGQPGRTVLILTVNPDAGRSSPTSFRPEAVYELVVDAAHEDRESVCLRVLFDNPAGDGSQGLRVLKATGHDAVDRGTEIGRGRIGEVGRLDVGGASGSVWAGLAADPFWADGVALAGFLGAVAEGRYEPEIFDGHANIFDGRNVSAVVLEIPDDALGNRALSIWARITLHGHAPQRRVSRMGQPMLRPLFFNVPGEETEELNRGNPASDKEQYRAKVVQIAEAVGKLAGVTDPSRHAVDVVGAFLPDVLRYTPGRPARFVPGSGNGRALHDDAFGIAVSLLAGHSLARSSAPSAASTTFPYVSRPQPGELPALLDLFGVRPAGADPISAPQ